MKCRLKTGLILFVLSIVVFLYTNQTYFAYNTYYRDVDCEAVINGNKKEIEYAKNLPPSIWSFQSIISLTCTEYRKIHGYDNIGVSDEEREFPIAFNILFYKDLTQIEFLLRSIYKPQNFYCLNVDGFSPGELHRNTRKLADCFNNVFIVSRTLNITYGGFNRLKADINCMEDHLAVSSKWKYLINLPGQEFPLKTNAEIVEILKVYNNSNDIESRSHSVFSYRFKYKWIIINVYHYFFNDMFPSGGLKMLQTNIKHEDPPNGLTIYKGSAYGIFSRGFVDYIINNKVSHELLLWCKDIFSPDEYFWPTLHRNKHLQVPGGFTGNENVVQHAAYVNWGNKECHGKLLRGICVLGVGDLHTLTKRPELFANKFEIGYQPSALQCLSKWLHNKTLVPQTLDLSFYKTLSFINNHF